MQIQIYLHPDTAMPGPKCSRQAQMPTHTKQQAVGQQGTGKEVLRSRYLIDELNYKNYEMLPLHAEGPKPHSSKRTNINCRKADFNKQLKEAHPFLSLSRQA